MYKIIVWGDSPEDVGIAADKMNELAKKGYRVIQMQGSRSGQGSSRWCAIMEISPQESYERERFPKY